MLQYEELWWLSAWIKSAEIGLHVLKLAADLHISVKFMISSTITIGFFFFFIQMRCAEVISALAKHPSNECSWGPVARYTVVHLIHGLSPCTSNVFLQGRTVCIFFFQILFLFDGQYLFLICFVNIMGGSVCASFHWQTWAKWKRKECIHELQTRFHNIPLKE